MWSSYGHRFASTDASDQDACLTCGAVFALVPAAPGSTLGDYRTASGRPPVHCTGDTSMAHGLSGERVCPCDRIDGCQHCRHSCNCLHCGEATEPPRAPEELLAALHAFQAAAVTLGELWALHNADHAHVLGHSYGLEPSFDELAVAIAGWEIPSHQPPPDPTADRPDF